MKNGFKKPNFFGFVYRITSAVFLTIFATWFVIRLSVRIEGVNNDMIVVALVIIVTLLLWVTILGHMWYKLFIPWNELDEQIAFIKLKFINQQVVDDEIRQLAIRVQQIHSEIGALSFDHKPDVVSEFTGGRLCEALSKFQAIQCLAKDLGFLVGKSYEDYLTPRVIYEPSELAKSGDMDYT